MKKTELTFTAGALLPVPAAVPCGTPPSTEKQTGSFAVMSSKAYIMKQAASTKIHPPCLSKMRGAENMQSVN